MTALEVGWYNVSAPSFDLPHQLPELDCFEPIIINCYLSTPFIKRVKILADQFRMSNKAGSDEGAFLSL